MPGASAVQFSKNMRKRMSVRLVSVSNPRSTAKNRKGLLLWIETQERTIYAQTQRHRQSVRETTQSIPLSPPTHPNRNKQMELGWAGRSGGLDARPTSKGSISSSNGRGGGLPRVSGAGDIPALYLPVQRLFSLISTHTRFTYHFRVLEK